MFFTTYIYYTYKPMLAKQLISTTKSDFSLSTNLLLFGMIGVDLGLCCQLWHHYFTDCTNRVRASNCSASSWTIMSLFELIGCIKRCVQRLLLLVPGYFVKRWPKTNVWGSNKNMISAGFPDFHLNFHHTLCSMKASVKSN